MIIPANFFLMGDKHVARFWFRWLAVRGGYARAKSRHELCAQKFNRRNNRVANMTTQNRIGTFVPGVRCGQIYGLTT
jgi:hypothetical protein